MHMHYRFAIRSTWLAALLVVVVAGCSSDSSNGKGGLLHMGSEGGNQGAGGATGLTFGQGGVGLGQTGGAQSAGDAPIVTGGSKADTGGAAPIVTGGAKATGGLAATGGSRATGGSSSVTGSCASMPTTTGYMTIASNGYAQSYYTTAAGFAYTWVGSKSIASSTCITPACGDQGCTPAFGSSAICAAGKLPADSTYNSVVGFGFNLNQPNVQGAAPVPLAAPASLKFYYTKSGTAQLRLQVGDGTNSWCFDTLGSNYSDFAIPIDEFNTACWDNSGEYLTAGTPITNVEIVVPSGTSAVTFADCLLDIAIGA